jgi:hypothetical protein
MATQFSYNGINLGLVQTVKVSQKAEYDPSNTDVMWITNRFNIRSVLSEGISGVDPLVGAAPQAARMAEIRHMLLQPRKPFVYSATDDNGSVDLVRVDAGANGRALDAANGPKPIDCDIIKVSEATWIIDFVIDVAIQDCTANQLFASNRFEVTHEIDHRGYSTITTLGKVFVRSDMRKTPDGLRWLVTPPLPAGFRRKSMYQLHEDGLSMMYRIVDSEMYMAPPDVACDATGRFTITAAPPGAILYAQCDVRLEGRKGQSKRQLMEQAILIALRRLEAGGIANDPRGKPWVEGGSVSEELYQNVVDVSLRGRILAGQTALKEGDQFNFFYGFWQGFFPFGKFGKAGLASGLGAGLLAKAWKAVGGVVSNDNATAANAARIATDDAKRRNAAAQAGAAGDAQDADPTAPPRKPTDKPLQPGAKNPESPFASVENFIDRFGIAPVGSHQDGTVNPGLYGNLHFMAAVAAAFRDPCVGDAFLSVSDPKLYGSGKTPVTGVVGGLGTDVSEYRTLDNWVARDYIFNYSQLSAILGSGRAGEALPDPSTDWRVQRLGRLVKVSADGSSLSMSEERALPEDIKPVPPVETYLGWYESWYCEVEHDVTMFADALPRTVSGRPAAAIHYANPLRKVTVRYAAEKAMWPPEVPMIVGDTNVVMTNHNMSLPDVTMSADGKTPIFSVVGEVTYKVLDETYVQVSYPCPPWLFINMRAMPGPIPRPSIIVTEGAVGANQDTVIAPILSQGLSIKPPGAGA